MAVRRRQGRLDPVGAKSGGREAEKRVLWGHMAAVYAGRAENSAWVAYAVQHYAKGDPLASTDMGHRMAVTSLLIREPPLQGRTLTFSSSLNEYLIKLKNVIRGLK
jgi:hypothetical protein